ncbi:acyl carrier protein [Reinekea marinisedimentorum]|uniref:Acyl carrier protein n=1 Tax=Reinekea marinisedimentorum TaxID=230495 RepID=A0A4R3I7Z6_9GAMM|nr:phosphopantetheine-binding protein [Reinekea marinisedimentorum]TCS41941.1 acyl carrier protein [Reinekea marinisedimentorum]
MNAHKKLLAIFNSTFEIVHQSKEGDVLLNTVTLDDNLAQKFDLDSLDMIEVFLRIQDEFGVEIDEDDYEKLMSLNDILAYIDACGK